MRRAHRRFHLLIWLIAAAGVAALGVAILSQPRPDIVETYQPPTQ